jgi:hypothetical protein
MVLLGLNFFDEYAKLFRQIVEFRRLEDLTKHWEEIWDSRIDDLPVEFHTTKNDGHQRATKKPQIQGLQSFYFIPVLQF